MPQSVQAPKTSTLAIIALVMSIVFFPVGVVLAIVALVRISSSRGALGGQAIAIVALVLSLVFVPTCGILAAIAIPSFTKFQCRAKQSEAKSNLKLLHVAQEGFFAEHGTYGADAAAIGFQPSAANPRYRYVVTLANASAFSAEARGEGNMAGDLWTIGNDGRPRSVANFCDR